MRRCIVALAVTFTVTATLRAQDHIAKTDPLSPADERKALTVPAGFEVQLVAAEPDIQKPIQMAFDAKGRLWVTTSHHYPFAAPPGQTHDKLFVLSDFGPDGKAKKVQVFADDLNIPIGILPLPDCNSCIVSSVGEILKLTDTDGDGKADKREVLFSGFGSRDTHGMYNSFTLMPDGWVYACHGYSNTSKVRGKDGHEVEMNSGNTFRFRPDGSRIEVYTRGQVNPFGIAVDPWFNLYTADCHSKPITQLIPGAYYDSFGKPHDGLGYAPHVTPHDHGSTALCGLTWYEADHFPKEYRGCMFLGNVVTNRINFDRIEWRGSTPVAKELPDFLVSKDPWFRPTDIKLGPDGALYVADFYNRIIGHYEVDLKHPLRDKDRGRVWRIVWKGDAGTAPAPKPAVDDLAKATNAELVKLLEHPNLMVRLTAANQFLGRKGEWWKPFFTTNQTERPAVKNVARVLAPFPMLMEHSIAAGGPEPDEKEGYYVNYLPFIVLAGDDPAGLELAVGMVRGMGSREKWGDELRRFAVALFKPEHATLRHPKVQRALVDAVAAHPHPDFVQPLIEVIQKCPAEDTHLRHAARIALRNCLRGGNDWAAADKLGKDAIPVLADVAVAVASPDAANFLAGCLENGTVAEDRLPVVAEHIGRHGKGGERSVVTRWAAGRKDGMKAVAVLHALIRGIQTRASDQLGTDDTNRILTRTRTELEGGSRQSRLAALKLLADLRSLFPPGYQYRGQAEIDPLPSLTRLVGESRQPDDVRATALDTLERLDQQLGRDTAVALIDDQQTPPPLREKAAVMLAAGDGNQKQAAKDAIKDVPYRSAVVIATALAGSLGGGDILLEAVKQGKAPARLLQERQVLDRLRASGVPDLDKQVKDFTKGLQPADQKLAELIKTRAAKLPAAKADKELGAKLFTKHCAACHQVAGMGAKIAPALDGIGARGPERLLEDVLDPNRNVDAAFRSRVLQLKDGTTKSGLMVRVEGEVLVMADDQGKEYRVPTKDIETNRETALSPMPANFGEVIPEADFYHLMAYLLDQKVKDPPPKK